MVNTRMQAICKADYEQISKLIRDDPRLLAELGFKSKPEPTQQEVKAGFCHWCESHQARMFSVYVEDRFAGLFTLSRIDKQNHTARVGYWLGSEFRGQGYGGRFYTEFLQLAKAEGLEQVNASIHKLNFGSRALWEKRGGHITSVAETNLELSKKHNR